MAYITREGAACHWGKAGRQNDDVKAPCRKQQNLCHDGQYNGKSACTV